MTLDFCELRELCGLEIADVALEFGTSLDAVSRWENGEALPPERVLRSLAILADFSAKPVEFRHDILPQERLETMLSAECLRDRKRKSKLGQFMTPPNVADFMASLFTLPTSKTVRLLDAGAGEGALTAAFIQRAKGDCRINATAIEFDHQILTDLRTNLAELTVRNKTECELIEADFIEEGVTRICLGKGERFTHSILNPPYKKIGSDTKHRALLRAAGLETVNLYTGFVGLALELLERGGEMVAIIPRSFCNGPYYLPFRRFILSRAAIQHIHLFDARNQAFKDDGVLQENIIIKMVRGCDQSSVTVSTSTDDSFADYSEKQHAFARIVFPEDAGVFIHIPTGDDEQFLEHANFSYSLTDLGLSVSTGPVVDFRLKQELCPCSTRAISTASACNGLSKASKSQMPFAIRLRRVNGSILMASTQ
jgi:adenine-specific DNA-methyltransferase